MPAPRSTAAAVLAVALFLPATGLAQSRTQPQTAREAAYEPWRDAEAAEAAQAVAELFAPARGPALEREERQARTTTDAPPPQRDDAAERVSPGDPSLFFE